MVKTRTIEFLLYLEAKPEEVYDIWMDSEKHAEFTESSAEIDPKEGGEFNIMDGYITGKNLRLIKGNQIMQEWKTSEWPDGYPPSIIEISLRNKEDGTELVFIQSQVPDQQADEYEKGWEDYYWTPLRKYLENRRD